MKHFYWLTLLYSLQFNLVYAQPDNWQIVRSKTEKKLQKMVEATRGVVGVSVLDLTDGERFTFNENLTFPQGSAIKIAILMEVYKQATEGKFKLTDLRWVDKPDKVGGSGVLNQLGDRTSQLSIRDLCVLMIVLSDNTATNMLIELVGMSNINKTMASLGLKQTLVQRKMMDTAARGRGDENLSTPLEGTHIMELLYKGQFLNQSACEDMLAILKKPKSGSIKAGLPAGIPVAFKPGGIPGVATEWAIVNLKERPYIVVIMGNYGLDNEFHEVMPKVSKVLYDYFWRKGRSTQFGTYVYPQLIKK